MDTLDHILIVDDDAEIRNLLSRVSAEERLAGDGCRRWPSDVAGARRGRIDLIVLDLMLPGEDGLTLCRNLRAKSSTFP